jgi:hypothetical protein
LQQEYIDVITSAIRTTTSVEKQLANSNANFNNFIVSDTAFPYVQGIVKQSSEITNNLIRIAGINDQLAINTLNVLREHVKNYSKTVVVKVIKYNYDL